MSIVRELWVRIETVHAVTYFADESRAAARDCGLRGFWMGYFGFRASPLGPVGPEVVERAFYNFAPAMVRRSIPDAWEYASPDDLVRARAAAGAAALRRVGADQLALATDVLASLTAAFGEADPTGRPLYAANRALDPPADPIEQLWQACTTLREQRGDSHVAALRAARVSGCQAHLLLAAEQGVPDEVLRDNRGWTVEEWDGARAALMEAGRIEGGALTAAGREVRARVEAATDPAAAEPWAALGEGAVAQVINALDPLAQVIAASGTIPYPNPMGLPRPDRLTR